MTPEEKVLFIILRERLKKVMAEVIAEARQKLERHEYDMADIAITVTLGKNPEEYKEPYPPHVKAALMLKAFGREVKAGDRIAYVYVRRNPGILPAELARPEDIDVERYMEMLFAVLEQVAEPFGIDVRKLEKKPTIL
ncbi:MAG: hypothetical protein DRJ03_17345 [Chloroflexi bacterium]|nr:MAG: hypothetical protein DRJ03_17345 [Chloroflexota bacterium]